MVDVFQGARTPAHLTTLEFYQVLLPLLQPAGIVIVNSAGGTSDGFLRREIATLQGLFKDVIAVAEPQVLKGKRYGNTVLMASNITDTSWRELQRIMRSGPYPASMLAGAELKKFTAGAKPITDAAAIPSPAPPPGFFA